MRSVLLAFLISFTLLSCKPNLKLPVAQQGQASFTRLVAVGDDYLSGLSNGALSAAGQQYSIPNQLATQCKTYFSSDDFNQPLLPGNFGFGVDLDVQNHTHYYTPFQLLHYTDCAGVDQLFPLRNELESTNAALVDGLTPVFTAGGFNNFAVPLARASDLSATIFGSTAEIASGGNPFYARFAQNQGQSTILHESMTLGASFFLLHLGMSDIYLYAKNGAASGALTLPADFQTYLYKTLDSLTANGAKGVIANIPSPEDLPYFNTIGSQGLVLDQQKADLLNSVFGGQLDFQVGANGFVMYDPQAPFGYRHLLPEEKVMLRVNTDSLKCMGLGSLYPLHSRDVLDTAELRILEAGIDAYNQVIEQAATAYGLAFVDLHDYFHQVQQGLVENGVAINSTLVSGNFFSLDGYTPTPLGYSLITNQFIQAINIRYGSTIPAVNTAGVPAVIFP